MRPLVIGRDGQLGRCLAERARTGTAQFVGRDGLDLADPVGIEALIGRHGADIVINAAAYTAVDRAEDEPELAMQVNGVAPGRIAVAAQAAGARLIHVSTDYVFDGSADRPYREDDPVAPLGVYGTTKLAGERAVAATGADALIVRTAWVYSPFGGNFVKTMLRLAADRDDLGVVADQFGSPTSAVDLADAIWALAENWALATAAAPARIVHAAGGGQASWAELAQAVFAESEMRGGQTAHVRPITTADYPTPARRPAWSVLSSDVLRAATGGALPDWRGSLGTVVERLLAGEAAPGTRHAPV